MESGERLASDAKRTRADRHSVQVEPKMVIFEHRSAAYFRYVSTEAQEIAICRPAWAECRSALSLARRRELYLGIAIGHIADIPGGLCEIDRVAVAVLGH